MTAAADALMGIFGFKRVEGEQMKTIEQTRRELFEAAYLKNYLYPAERWSLVPEKYRTQHAEIAWWAFNAAMDSICIEFPKCSVSMFANSRESMGVMAGVEMSRYAIESTNLGLKII